GFNVRYSVEDTTIDSNVYTDKTEALTYGDTFVNPTDYIEEIYTVTVNAVTDNATSSLGTITDTDGKITVTNSDEVNVTDNTIFRVPFILTADDVLSEGTNGNSLDVDGSETLHTTITITGVPEGISVVGGTYSGDIFVDMSGENRIVNSGSWILNVPTDSIIDTQDTINNIEFKVDGEVVRFNEITTDGTVTITVKHSDLGSTTDTDSEMFIITADGFGGEDGIGSNPTVYNETGGAPMDIVLTGNSDVQFLEDISFKLSDLYTASDYTETSNDSGKFAVIIEADELPAGYSISGMMSADVGNGTFYYVLGDGDVDDINTIFTNISITPLADVNVNTPNTINPSFKVHVTTYNAEVESEKNRYEAIGDGELAPQTDSIVVNVTSTSVVESDNDTDSDTYVDATQTITVSLAQGGDDGRVIIKNNELYVKFTENYTDDSSASGKITYDGDDISTLTTQIIDGETYYIIPNVDELSDTVSFEYNAPVDRYGNVTANTIIYTKEDVQGSTDLNGDIYITEWVKNTGSGGVTITPLNEGITGFDASAVGYEDTIVHIDIADTIKFSDDPTESISNTVTLSGISDKFDVYFGVVGSENKVIGEIADAEYDATTGSIVYTYDYTFTLSGDLTNIDNVKTQLEQIGIKSKLQNWHGELEDITLSLTSGEGGSGVTSTKTFDFVFSADADNLISMIPTKTLGDESEWTPINLNANIEDVDGSETITVELVGDGSSGEEGFEFSLNVKDGDSGVYTRTNLADLTDTNAIYNVATDTWTITGIKYDKINDLEVITPIGYKGTHSFTAKVWSVEKSNLDMSAVESGTFNMILDSKASGVETSSFGTTIANDITICSSSYEMVLKISGVDLLDKDGSEKLYIKLSGLTDSLEIDITDLVTGMSATKDGSDWIVEVGTPSDLNNNYTEALTHIQNSGLTLKTTSTNGTVDDIEVTAYSYDIATKETKDLDTVDGTVSVDLTVDADGTINGTTGDDIILYNGTDIIHGGDGIDTIVLEEGITLDFSLLDNIEVIDLEPNGNHILDNLKLSDVLDMTDDDNELIITGITGDDVDTITNDLTMGDAAGEWTKESTDDNGGSHTYHYSQNGSGDSIALTIDDQINHTGLVY
ncbi:MAG: hypothetical protein K8R44_08020, partial [Sulfurimonas sp.]|nr:hypothetical protein [Sulfurimonas sp.]